MDEGNEADWTKFSDKNEPTKRPSRVSAKKDAREIYRMISEDRSHEVFGEVILPRYMYIVLGIFYLVVPIALVLGAILSSDNGAIVVLSFTLVFYLIILTVATLPVVLVLQHGKFYKIIMNNQGIGNIYTGRYSKTTKDFEWKDIEKIAIEQIESEIKSAFFIRKKQRIHYNPGRFCRNLTLEDLLKFLPTLNSWKKSKMRARKDTWIYRNPEFV